MPIPALQLDNLNVGCIRDVFVSLLSKTFDCPKTSALHAFRSISSKTNGNGVETDMQPIEKQTRERERRVEYLKSLFEVFVGPELLDDSDEAIFIDGAAFLDPLVEDR